MKNDTDWKLDISVRAHVDMLPETKWLETTQMLLRITIATDSDTLAGIDNDNVTIERQRRCY